MLSIRTSHTLWRPPLSGISFARDSLLSFLYFPLTNTTFNWWATLGWFGHFQDFFWQYVSLNFSFHNFKVEETLCFKQWKFYLQNNAQLYSGGGDEWLHSLIVVLNVSLFPMKGVSPPTRPNKRLTLQSRIISTLLLIHLIYFFSNWFIQRKMAGSSPHSANLFSRITARTGENSNTPPQPSLHLFLQFITKCKITPSKSKSIQTYEIKKKKNR